ncbi:MAG TPA: ribbon-helix-helix domain-containing protein [Acidobacteriota bacterium]
MSTTKVAITLDQKTLAELDRLVKRRIFPSRSRAIQEAIDEKLRRLKRTRLAEECSKLDPEFEKALADEGFASELTQWPEY